MAKPVTIRDIKVITTQPAHSRLIVVKVLTSEPGLYGLGCATFTQRWRAVVAAIEGHLKPFLLGRDVSRIEEIFRMSMVHGYWRNGPVLNNAISGVDIALWDIMGKRAGMPVYQVLGDDIVMYGLEVVNPVHTSDSIQIDITPGAAIQDQTLIVSSDSPQLEITGVSGMDESGRIVVMSNYNYLETFEKNENSFNVNYVDTTGSPLHSFMSQRDRIVLAILRFTKDASDNVTGVSFAQENSITIDGKEYFVKRPN